MLLQPLLLFLVLLSELLLCESVSNVPLSAGFFHRVYVDVSSYALRSTTSSFTEKHFHRQTNRL